IRIVLRRIVHHPWTLESKAERIIVTLLQNLIRTAVVGHIYFRVRILIRKGNPRIAKVVTDGLFLSKAGSGRARSVKKSAIGVVDGFYFSVDAGGAFVLDASD